MDAVLKAALASIEQGLPSALVSPVMTSGSLPMGRYARMLVFANGSSKGTAGGGRMEAEAQMVALNAIETNTAQLLRISLTAQDALADGLLCGGEATFLIEPLEHKDLPELTEISRLAKKREMGLEVVHFAMGKVSRLVVGYGGRSVGSLNNMGLDEAVLNEAQRLMDEDVQESMEVEVGGVKNFIYLRPIRVCPVPWDVLLGGHICKVAGGCDADRKTLDKL